MSDPFNCEGQEFSNHVLIRCQGDTCFSDRTQRHGKLVMSQADYLFKQTDNDALGYTTSNDTWGLDCVTSLAGEWVKDWEPFNAMNPCLYIGFSRDYLDYMESDGRFFYSLKADKMMQWAGNRANLGHLNRYPKNIIYRIVPNDITSLKAALPECLELIGIDGSFQESVIQVITDKIEYVEQSNE